MSKVIQLFPNGVPEAPKPPMSKVDMMAAHLLESMLAQAKQRAPEVFAAEKALQEKKEIQINRMDDDGVEYSASVVSESDERPAKLSRQSMPKIEQKESDDETIIPAGYKPVYLKKTFDNSDMMTDYYNPSFRMSEELLGYIPAGKQRRFKTMMRIVDQFPEFEKLDWELVQEEYSMGRGTFLEAVSDEVTPEGVVTYGGSEYVPVKYEISFYGGAWAKRAAKAEQIEKAPRYKNYKGQIIN